MPPVVVQTIKSPPKFPLLSKYRPPHTSPVSPGSVEKVFCTELPSAEIRAIVAKPDPGSFPDPANTSPTVKPPALRPLPLQFWLGATATCTSSGNPLAVENCVTTPLRVTRAKLLGCPAVE